jgi:predicted  nucleic acid-binding Zn-ribbon protein
MSDLDPNLELNKKRLSVRVTEMKLQLERLDLRKLEIAEELRKIEENIKATNLDIQNTQEQISKMK